MTMKIVYEQGKIIVYFDNDGERDRIIDLLCENKLVEYENVTLKEEND